MAFFVILSYLSFLKIKSNNKYLIIFGLALGSLFLIKFNACLLISFGFFLYCLFNFKKEIALFNLKNFLYFIFGLALPLGPFIIIYRAHFSELIYWLFTYNFTEVLPIARFWPPYQFSLFFLILIFNILVLSLIFFYRQNYEKYYRLTFPVISSTCLLLVAYPLYGDFHLLPALPGFLTGLIWFFKKEIYDSVFNCLVNHKKYIFRLSLGLIFFYLLLAASYSFFCLAKETLRIFWSRSGDYYYTGFSAGSVAYLTNKEKCNYLYVYPANQSNQMMYLEMPTAKRIKFVYPNWNWTFAEKMQGLILAELIDKKVDCILVADEPSEYTLHSQMIEKYIGKNYLAQGKIIWQVYRFKSLLPFKFITDYKKNNQNISYSLLKRKD